MEMRHCMTVWAPSDAELAKISRQVSRERAKAATGLLKAISSWFTGDDEPSKYIRPPVIKTPFYY